MKENDGEGRNHDERTKSDVRMKYDEWTKWWWKMGEMMMKDGRNGDEICDERRKNSDERKTEETAMKDGKV